ncbi:MAG: histidine phosphatase family protein [Candidatus Promineifilaceae bacterium]|nr:histidine phosphatase family protein [Candidatus Promineifilaceae bacterium]
MKLLITRHGESEANVRQIISNRDLQHVLTQKGKEQALQLADDLAAYDVNDIYCSPILRARETAEIVACRLELGFTITDALLEFDCGMMEGRGDAEAWQAHSATVRAWDVYRQYDRCIPPDGESFHDMQDRFLPFMAEITGQSEGTATDILLISHGGMLHQMLPLFLANIDRDFTRRNQLKNCALVVAEEGNGGWRCVEWSGRKM